VSAYPERIVCLTEETTETLYLLGEGHRVAGISGYTLRRARSAGKTEGLVVHLSAVRQDRSVATRSALTEGVRRIHDCLASMYSE
jgi:iron complex transport system substrate-binding protein